ncbi:energy-coupling factor transporter transmembrane component T [Rothia sp. ZJ932]|uniref:energy-coupling factor transporter transmembrane component T n=1 Tax=Rothia sp. ZJ932 TaxID=2810516 RepID=UPI001968054F|nr:energy-coupling factor transporter transmembrane component T [Rothia sp. ZJ932]QRZ61319.1 hypothetical protein JR346_08780 [Rothia sp. ZJ932]
MNLTNGINPKTWIVAGLAATPLALLPLPLSLRTVLLVVLVTPLLATGHGSKLLRYVLWGVGPVALTAFIIQTVSYPGAGTIYAQWVPAPWIRFAISAEGIAYGAQFALQILNFAAAIALISLPNSVGALRWALTSWKLPARLVYILVTSLNAPALLGRYIRIIREGQIRRGLDDSTLLKRISLGIKSLGTLVNLMLLEHEDRAHSIAQRGLDNKTARTSYLVFVDTRAQQYLRAVLVGASALICAAVVL